MSNKKAASKAAPALARFEVGLLPVPAKLTPKRAQRWLETEAGTWHDLLERIAWVTNTDEERTIAASLSLNVRNMVDACAAAVGSGRAVRLVSAVDGMKGNGGFPWWGNAVDLVRLIDLAMASEQSELGGATINAVRGLCSHLLAMIRAGWQQQAAAHKRLDPTPREVTEERIDELLERKDELERYVEKRHEHLEQTVLAGVQGLIDDALAEDRRELRMLGYHVNALAAKRGYKDPGPPPEGYDPVDVERAIARGAS